MKNTETMIVFFKNVDKGTALKKYFWLKERAFGLASC